MRLLLLPPGYSSSLHYPSYSYCQAVCWRFLYLLTRITYYTLFTNFKFSTLIAHLSTLCLTRSIILYSYLYTYGLIYYSSVWCLLIACMVTSYTCWFFEDLINKRGLYFLLSIYSYRHTVSLAMISLIRIYVLNITI